MFARLANGVRLVASQRSVPALILGAACLAAATAVSPTLLRTVLAVCGFIGFTLGILLQVWHSYRERRAIQQALRASHDRTAQLERRTHELDRREEQLRSNTAAASQMNAAIDRIRRLERNTTSVAAHQAVEQRISEQRATGASTAQGLRSLKTEVSGLSSKMERIERLTVPTVARVAAAGSTATSSGPYKLTDHQSAVDSVFIADIPLMLLDGNNDRRWYQERGVFEERNSRLYPLISDAGFVNFVDVGASYGFVSILAAKACPGIRIVALEADPRLPPLIEANLDQNGITDALILNALVGDVAEGIGSFSLNPTSTLDNRVDMDGWLHEDVALLSIDAIAQQHDLTGKTFIKIDTQGFELNVLRGAEQFLAERDDWIIKMEYGPDWLRSQSTDPAVVLRYLNDRYEVAESPLRMPYVGSTLDGCFEHLLAGTDVDTYIEYVESLNVSGRGWVDLLVRPRTRR